MTNGEIKTEVLRRLRESSSTPTFWSDRDISASIHQAYAEISDASEWNEQQEVISLPSNNIPVFDIRQFTTQEFLVAGPAYNSITSRWLQPGSIREFDLYDRAWETRVGEVEYALVRGLWWLTYWPFDTGSITQYYIAVPDRMTADADEPGFPEEYHYGLVEYAIFDLWAQDGEADLAYAAWREYLKYEAGLTAWVNGRIGVPKITGNRQSAFGS